MNENEKNLNEKNSWDETIDVLPLFFTDKEVVNAKLIIGLLRKFLDLKPDIRITDLISAMKEWNEIKKQIKKNKKSKKEEKPVVVESNPEPAKVVVDDTQIIKSLIWLHSGDGGDDHGDILPMYDSTPFQNISNLPIDFECTININGCSITIPKSDTTRCMGEAGERRAVVCLFDKFGQLVCTEDFNGTFIDNRWRDKGATQGFVIHILNNKMTSRTKLTEIK